MKILQSETAISAFHGQAQNVIPHQQQVILDAMEPNTEYTIGELAKLTGLDKSAVSGRRNSMLKAGLLEYGVERPCAISGIRCETVRLPGGVMQMSFGSRRGFW